ncbi:hypothetical protein [Caudoviricetes sp.]|nr:hypothetical protein [Caudoviricetes sp.]
MNDALKLKDNLVTNVPMTLKIKKLIGSYPDKDFKTKEPNGKTIFLYVFTGSLDGKEYKHYCTEHENELISGIGVGGIVQVTRTEKAGKDGKRIYPLQWSVPGSAEAVAAPQIKSTSAVVAEERQAKAHAASDEERQYRMALAGLVQAYIIQGQEDDEAFNKACAMRVRIAQEANKLATSAA